MNRFFAVSFAILMLFASTAEGKGYSSGGHSSSGSHSSGFGHSFSSGSHSFSSGGSAPSFGRSSTGSSSSPGSRKPTSSSFNSGLSQSAQHAESRTRYQASAAPKTSYTTSTGQTRPIQADSPHVQTIRRYVTHERYVTYDNRSSIFYGGYYSHPYYYNDPYSPFLMGWLLSDALSSHDRALWMYNHRSDMDDARYNAMLQKDANLQAEINQLQAQNAARDPSYVPPQMAGNPDIMYNKDFVNASYNPVPVEEYPSEYSEGEGGHGFLIFLGVVVILGLCGTAAYFLFFKDYK